MSPPNIETDPHISLLGSSLLVRVNAGRTLHAFGHAVVILLDGKQTGGKFTAFLNMTPPGGGAGLHYHEREDEWFYMFYMGFAYKKYIGPSPISGHRLAYAKEGVNGSAPPDSHSEASISTESSAAKVWVNTSWRKIFSARPAMVR